MANAARIHRPHYPSDFFLDVQPANDAGGNFGCEGESSGAFAAFVAGK